MTKTISIFAFIMIFVVMGVLTALALVIDPWWALLYMLLGASWVALFASTSEWLRAQFERFDKYMPDERFQSELERRVEEGRVSIRGMI